MLKWAGFARPADVASSAASSAAHGAPHDKLAPEPLWLEWAALGGLLLFATWLLGVRGVWTLLLV